MDPLDLKPKIKVTGLSNPKPVGVEICDACDSAKVYKDCLCKKCYNNLKLFDF